ncbi:MAG: TonB-dependent receptor plug domain-containing protein [Woeseiaceae bacterium]
MFKLPPMIAVILLITTSCQSVLAEELDASLLTENDFFNDIPVVLTATRLKQSKSNSPVATTIIDRKMIEASGFTEIVDLLRLAPGMLVNNASGHTGASGYQFLFDHYRVRQQVLVDGMSVYTPLFGQMPWTQLGLTVDNIERIEIIRGPSSASYGPNAMTGVISIITRHAALDKGLKFKVTQGAYGRSELFFTLGDTKGNFDYRLSLSARKDDGFKERYDNKDLSIVNFRGDYQATNKDVITFLVSNNSGIYQEDSPLDDHMPEHTKNVKYSTFQTKWTHSFLDGDDISLNYYHQDYNDNNTFLGDYTNDGFGFVTIDEGAKTNRNNIEVTYSTSSDWYSVTFGALYRKDNTISSQYLYNVDKDIITQQVFTNAELQLSEKNILNIGLLHDDNDTGGTTLAPRIAFNHHINKNHTARISYTESTRSPFVFEEYTNRVIYIDGFGDFPYWSDLSDLKPERIKSFDLGYIAMLNNNSTEIDLRIYKNFLTDIILLDTAVSTGGFLQGSEFNITGFEASISHQFKNTRVKLNYASTKIDDVKSVLGDNSDYERGTPSDIISLLVMHDFNSKVKGSLGYYYTGSYQELCCATGQQAPRNRLDLTLSKSFEFSGYNSQIKFVLQNVTNEKISTRFDNNYDQQGYISFSLEL